MKRIRRILPIAVVTLTILAFWSYRKAVATSRAAEYLPSSLVLPLIPAGTEIRVVLSNGITEGTRPGDTVMAFIAVPVVVGNVPLLPNGLQLNGIVEKIDKNKETAGVQIRFHEIVFNGKSSAIEATPVVTTARINSDFNTLANGFNTLAGAGVGLALGTASRDTRAIAEGLAGGARNGVPQPTADDPQVTLVLTQPLRVRAS